MDSVFYVWLYKLISYIFRFYEFSIIIYILSSWFPKAKDNAIIKFFEDICEPYLRIFRKIVPTVAMLDFSPILAILALSFIERIVYSILLGMPLF